LLFPDTFPNLKIMYHLLLRIASFITSIALLSILVLIHRKHVHGWK